MFRFKRGGREETEVDMVKANKKFLGEPPEFLEVDYDGVKVQVFFGTGLIKVNDKLVFLGLPKNFKPKEFRWVNFKRHSVKVFSNGGLEDSVVPVVGWQATFNGRNYQRLVALKNGGWELWKKR